jgi:hypothetical protein
MMARAFSLYHGYLMFYAHLKYPGEDVFLHRIYRLYAQ